jgi:hypothetical protein
VVEVKDSPSGHRSSTREQRGLQIAREHGDEVWPCGEGYWRVPGSDGMTVYLVDVARESCSCEDHTRTRKPCKHLYAVLTMRAKLKDNAHETPHGCIGGWVYLGFEGEDENGEHVEDIERVPCRRCQSRSSDKL